MAVHKDMRAASGSSGGSSGGHQVMVIDENSCKSSEHSSEVVAFLDLMKAADTEGSAGDSGCGDDDPGHLRLHRVHVDVSRGAESTKCEATVELELLESTTSLRERLDSASLSQALTLLEVGGGVPEAFLYIGLGSDDERAHDVAIQFLRESGGGMTRENRPDVLVVRHGQEPVVFTERFVTSGPAGNWLGSSGRKFSQVSSFRRTTSQRTSPAVDVDDILQDIGVEGNWLKEDGNDKRSPTQEALERDVEALFCVDEAPQNTPWLQLHNVGDDKVETISLQEASVCASCEESSVRVWRVGRDERYLLTEVPEARLGVFTSEDAYAIFCKYATSAPGERGAKHGGAEGASKAISSEGSEALPQVLYLWLGRDTTDDLKLAARMQVEGLVEDLGIATGGSSNTRLLEVEQGKESALLLATFMAQSPPAPFVILNGSAQPRDKARQKGSATATEVHFDPPARVLELNQNEVFPDSHAVMAAEISLEEGEGARRFIQGSGKSFIILENPVASRQVCKCAHVWHQAGESPAVEAMGIALCRDLSKLFLPTAAINPSRQTQSRMKRDRKKKKGMGDMLMRGVIQHITPQWMASDDLWQCLGVSITSTLQKGWDDEEIKQETATTTDDGGTDIERRPPRLFLIYHESQRCIDEAGAGGAFGQTDLTQEGAVCCLDGGRDQLFLWTGLNAAPTEQHMNLARKAADSYSSNLRKRGLVREDAPLTVETVRAGCEPLPFKVIFRGWKDFSLWTTQSFATAVATPEPSSPLLSSPGSGAATATCGAAGGGVAEGDLPLWPVDSEQGPAPTASASGRTCITRSLEPLASASDLPEQEQQTLQGITQSASSMFYTSPWRLSLAPQPKIRASVSPGAGPWRDDGLSTTADKAEGGERFLDLSSDSGDSVDSLDADLCLGTLDEGDEADADMHTVAAAAAAGGTATHERMKAGGGRGDGEHFRKSVVDLAQRKVVKKMSQTMRQRTRKGVNFAPARPSLAAIPRGHVSTQSKRFASLGRNDGQGRDTSSVNTEDALSDSAEAASAPKTSGGPSSPPEQRPLEEGDDLGEGGRGAKSMDTALKAGFDIHAAVLCARQEADGATRRKSRASVAMARAMNSALLAQAVNLEEPESIHSEDSRERIARRHTQLNPAGRESVLEQQHSGDNPGAPNSKAEGGRRQIEGLPNDEKGREQQTRPLPLSSQPLTSLVEEETGAEHEQQRQHIDEVEPCPMGKEQPFSGWGAWVPTIYKHTTWR